MILLFSFHWSCNSLVEMNVRRDEINVTLNVFRDAVFLASDVGLASAGVRVLIVLCLQKIFGFIDSDISMQPVKTTRLLPRDCYHETV